MTEHADVLITGATIFDGKGRRLSANALAVRDGRIRLHDSACHLTARLTLDAHGRFLAPGFIDVHAHSDFRALVHPGAQSRILAGFTTDVSGNCGYGAFPLRDQARAARQRELEAEPVTIDWHDAATYLDRAEATPSAMNRALLLGHGALRGSVIGYADRPANRDELRRMETETEAAMDAGAFGLSTGLIYPPSCFGSPHEIAALVAVVHRRGGYYTSHIRSEGDQLIEAVDEFLDVLRRTGSRGLLSHVKTASRRNWHKLPLLRDRLAAARAAGLDLYCDRYPYTASATSLAAILLPNWALEGGDAAILARLRDLASRRRIEDDIRRREADHIDEFYAAVVLTRVSLPARKQHQGQSLAQIAAQDGAQPLGAALDLLIEDHARTEAIHHSMSADNLREIMGWDFVMVGSDSSVRSHIGPCDDEQPHPRAYGTPARFLQTLVKEQRVVTWEQAFAKLSGLAAEVVGLKDRGAIADGYWADLVLLDPEQIADRATYQDPCQPPAGICHVFVNGCPVVLDGRVTGQMPGRVLRRGQN